MTEGFRAQVIGHLSALAESPASAASAVALKALTKHIYTEVNASRAAALGSLGAAFERSGWAARALDRALVAGLVCLHLNLAPKLCRDGILAALICDLGEQLLPPASATDPGAWAMHARLSVDLLSEGALSPDAQRAILEHHERLDGSGQPFGLTADGLGLLGRIVAVADVFGQLRGAGSSPAEAVESMREHSLPGLDRAIFGALVEARACTLVSWERVPA